MTFVRRAALARELGLTPQGFGKFVARTSTFPRPVKLGATRQAGVLFDRAEVDQWLKARKEKSQ